jgi:hypothetical protein
LSRKERLIDIPKDKIQQGIALSLDMAQRHLECSKFLVEKGFHQNAVETIEHAIEEFGRAVYLRERLAKGLETMSSYIETKHFLKYDKAFEVLPEKSKTIWEFPTQLSEGYINTDISFRYNEKITPETRKDVIFLKYNERTKQWQNGIMVDGKKLAAIIEEIKNCILEFTW